MSRVNKSVKVEFGERLRMYRELTGLEIVDYGKLIGKGHTYVNNVELGKTNIGVENMESLSKPFGVRYYQLANPNYPIPTLDQMPASIRRAAAKAAKAREKAEADKQAKREAGEGVYTTGAAKELHALIANGFFKTPRTAREAYLKLNPTIDADNLTAAQRTGVGKITGTLSKGKFAKLLDKLGPLKGSTTVRFVEKG